MWLNWINIRSYAIYTMNITYDELIKYRPFVPGVAYFVQAREKFPYNEVEYTFLVNYNDDQCVTIQIQPYMNGLFALSKVDRIIQKKNRGFDYLTFHPRQTVTNDFNALKIKCFMEIKPILQKVVAAKHGQILEEDNLRKMQLCLDNIHKDHPILMTHTQVKYPIDYIDLSTCCVACGGLCDINARICQTCNELTTRMFWEYQGIRDLERSIGKDLMSRVFEFLYKLI